MNDVDKAIRANAEHLAKRGPALSFAYTSYVVARNPAEGTILLGGLGGMGVGQMWVMEDDDHKDYPGYAEAEITAEQATTMMGVPLVDIHGARPR